MEWLFDFVMRTFPPPLPELASPASLACMKATRDRPFQASGRDAKIWFDQLTAPPRSRRCFGRPKVCAGDLLKARPSDGGPESLTELQSYCTPWVELDSQSTFTPLSRVFPMGFSWSLSVAQSYMISCIGCTNFFYVI